MMEALVCFVRIEIEVAYVYLVDLIARHHLFVRLILRRDFELEQNQIVPVETRLFNGGFFNCIPFPTSA